MRDYALSTEKERKRRAGWILDVFSWLKGGRKGKRPGKHRLKRAGAQARRKRKAAARRRATGAMTKALVRTRIHRGQDPRTGR